MSTHDLFLLVRGVWSLSSPFCIVSIIYCLNYGHCWEWFDTDGINRTFEGNVQQTTTLLDSCILHEKRSKWDDSKIRFVAKTADFHPCQRGDALPKSNISAEKGWLEDYFLFGKACSILSRSNFGLKKRDCEIKLGRCKSYEAKSPIF